MRFALVDWMKQSSPYRGLMWLVVFVVVFVGAVVGLRYGFRSGERDEARDKAAGAGSWCCPTPEADRVKGEEYSPLPPVKPKEVPAYLTDPKTLTQVTDSETLDSYPFYYLLYQLKAGDPGALAREAQPVPAMAELAKLSAGAAVSLEGKVRGMDDRADLGIPDADILKASEYEIEDAGGNLYLVYAAVDVSGIEVGDDVKVVGRYFRFHKHLPSWEGEEAKERRAPVVVVREVDGSRHARDAACLAKVRDGVFGEEAKAFYYLITLVGDLSQDELKRRASPALTEQVIDSSPAEARGKFVAVDGALLRYEPRNEAPNIAGVKRLYRCILRTRDNRWYWVYTLDDPKQFSKRDVVRAYGVFFKRRLYRSDAGFEQTTFLMMARRLVAVRLKNSYALAILALVIGGVTFVALAVAMVVESLKRREHERRVQELAAKMRPKNINEAGRNLAARMRQARDANAGSAGGSDDGPRPAEPGGAG